VDMGRRLRQLTPAPSGFLPPASAERPESSNPLCQEPTESRVVRVHDNARTSQ
jgi:hypothetical protein